jgi:hypothetical protein
MIDDFLSITNTNSQLQGSLEFFYHLVNGIPLDLRQAVALLEVIGNLTTTTNLYMNNLNNI